MFERISLKYPRNWTETKRILKSLDIRWIESAKIQDKHRRIKEWINIARDANVFYKAAKEREIMSLDAVEYVKENESFVKLMVETVNLNFHRKNLRTIESWMSSKKIPIQR